MFVLNFGCLKARLANIMGNPKDIIRVHTPAYNCGACSYFNGDWAKKFFLSALDISYSITKYICSGGE